MCENKAQAMVDDLLTFDRFELDVRRRRLLRAGRLVRLAPQPMTILLTLARRPGEIVSRKELHAALWPADTHVEFDAGLNTAVRRLRRALGDTPADPRFIQTVPGSGYRFIHPIERAARHVPSRAAASPPAPSPQRRRPRIMKPAQAAVLAIVAALIFAIRPGPDSRALNALHLANAGEQLARVGDHGSLVAAKRDLEEAASHDAELGRTWGWLAFVTARLAFSNGGSDTDYELAMAAAERAVAMDRRLWTGHAALGYVKAGRGDAEGAAAAFARAVAAGADLPRVFIDYACVLKTLGRAGLALNVIEAGLRYSPESAPLQAHRGLYLHAVGRYDEELISLREAVAVDPDSAEAHFHLGLGYARRRQYAESLAALEKAVTLSDGAPQFLSWLGRIAADAGRRREAEGALAALRRRAASSHVPPALIDAVTYHLSVSRS